MSQQQQTASRRSSAKEVRRQAEAFENNPFAPQYRRRTLPMLGQLRPEEMPAAASFPHMVTETSGRGTMKVVKFSAADDRPIVMRVGLVRRPRPA